MTAFYIIENDVDEIDVHRLRPDTSMFCKRNLIDVLHELHVFTRFVIEAIEGQKPWRLHRTRWIFISVRAGYIIVEMCRLITKIISTVERKNERRPTREEGSFEIENKFITIYPHGASKKYLYSRHHHYVYHRTPEPW